jgi:hypothetical protein
VFWGWFRPEGRASGLRPSTSGMEAKTAPGGARWHKHIKKSEIA